MLTIKSSISCEVLPTSVIYCLIYIPPNSSDEYLHKFFSFLITFKNVSDNFILLGDFNFNDINWDSLYGRTPSSAKFYDIWCLTSILYMKLSIDQQLL